MSHGASLVAVHDPVEPDTSSASARVPPALGAIHVVSVMVAVGAPPACITVTTCPATVIVPVRGCAGVVASTTTFSVALPCPLVGATESHAASLTAVHGASAADAVRTTEASAPPTGASSDSGDAVNALGAPCCMNVTTCPAIETVPLRDCTSACGATVTVTLVEPTPDCGCTASHGVVEDAVHEASGSVLVSVTVTAPPVAGRSTLPGVAVNEGVAPACFTVTTCPPIVSVPVRENADAECGPAVMVMVASPTPLTRSRTSQDASANAVHGASEGETVTSTGAVPPAAGMVTAVGPAVIDGVAPACVTVNVWPATVIAPVRAETDDVWAAIETPRVALPAPAAGMTVSQGCELVADQEASGTELVSVSVRVAAADPMSQVVGATVKVGVAPDCVTATLRPAMVAVAVRGRTDVVCAVAVNVVLPLPIPEEGLTDNHAASVDADHEAAAGALVTTTTCVPPAAGGAHVVGLMPSVAIASAASAMRMRGNTSALRGSVIPTPVVLSAARMSLTEAAGTRCRSRAHAPET